MNKDKLKGQLPSKLLGISEKCVAVALAAAGLVAGSQAVSASVPTAETAPVAQVGPAVAGSSAVLLTMSDPATGQQVADHQVARLHASHSSHASHYSGQ